MSERKVKNDGNKVGSKEDLPQINQLITDHPESFVKAKTAADLNDKNKLLLIAVTKRKTDYRICASRRATVRRTIGSATIRKTNPTHISNKRKYERNPKKFAEYLMLEAKKEE